MVSYCTVGTTFQFGETEKVLRLDVVIPAPGKLRQENYALEVSGLHGEDLSKD